MLYFHTKTPNQIVLAILLSPLTTHVSLSPDCLLPHRQIPTGKDSSLRPTSSSPFSRALPKLPKSSSAVNLGTELSPTRWALHGGIISIARNKLMQRTKIQFMTTWHSANQFIYIFIFWVEFELGFNWILAIGKGLCDVPVMMMVYI